MKQWLIRGLLSLLIVFGIGVRAAQVMSWQDPGVNEVNRMEAHADFVNKNELRMSLHGLWGTMPIPGMWELNGLGEPMYCGQNYEWKAWWKSNPPELPDSGNYSYTYARSWQIPQAWRNRDVILHIGSVTPCVEVWCNGRYVGYGEDSKLEQEFDITPFVKFGRENEIKMEVRRWCDGSYLEDQDFFRFKGFARDTYLAARNKQRIEDVKVEALLNDDFSEGTVRLDVKTRGKVKWKAEIEGVGGLTVKHPKLWSAELPNLYALHITSDKGDDITINVGFRKVEIKDAQLDGGIDKGKVILPNPHSELLQEADCTNLCIDLVQQGQACIDSWSARPLDRYMVHTQDMQYTFRITPIIKGEPNLSHLIPRPALQ